MRIYSFLFLLFFGIQQGYTLSVLPDNGKADSTEQKEEKFWSYSNQATLYLSQIAYSEYWKGSGYNNITLGGDLGWKAIYKKDKSNFTFASSLQYGLMKRDKQDWVKNRDKLELNGNYGYKFSDKMFLSAIGNMRTFMTKTYKINADGMRGNFLGSFASPLTIDIGTGLNIKSLAGSDSKNTFDIYYTPINSKITITRDSTSAAQYLPEKFREDRYRVELGSLVKFVMSFTIMKNVTLQSKADFFTNHLSNFGNFDVNIESKLKMKVNSKLSVDILGNLVYDEDIKFDILDEEGSPTGRSGPRVQLSESINLGLTHSF
ncbi:DUF3078 domain-containing protein [Membranihabitans marinus]|uniref:DUF3078 domain-containing protein n=1 Tax=Membranihabitans marinus TaxID=1227546 RepID=UPI001F17857C|nr:DUF3078 domain-containing protein [Membranihabitans marinus]